MTDNECTTCGRAGHIAEDCPHNKAVPRVLCIAVGICTLLAIAMLAGCATKPEGAAIKLTAEQAQKCAEQGGCIAATRAGLAHLVDKAIEAGRQTCGKEQAL